MKKEAIEISQYWEEELNSMPYLSCKWCIILYSLTFCFLL